MPKSSQGVMFQDYNISNGNFFAVNWLGDSFPSPANNCGGDESCVLQNGVCLCNVTVVDSVVFSARPSVTAVVANLFIGSVPISWHGSSYILTEKGDGVDVYQLNGT